MIARIWRFPFRLLVSLKAAAEKLAAIQIAETFFAERKERGDIDAALRFLTRKGGEGRVKEMNYKAGGISGQGGLTNS